MKISKNLPLIILMWFVIFTFFVGLGVCLSPEVTKENMMNFLSDNKKIEGMTTQETTEPSEPNSNCPNMLVKSGNKLMLYFAHLPKSEVNPMIFNTLEEYSAFIETQRENGLRCPVLFLQEETNTQGEDVYRMRPNPYEMNGGANVLPVQPMQPMQPMDGPVKIDDASRSGNIFNADMYPGFDSHGTYIGVYTTLDQIHDSTQGSKLSDNPMDTNWGGVQYSQQAVDSGKYNDRIVGKQTMVPKVLA